MTIQVSPLRNVPEDFERYVATRERMQEEIKFRRERQWNVFSWISSLLLAIIGGTIALYSNGRDFAMPHKWLLAVAVALFAIFGIIRIRHDRSVSIFYTEACWSLDEVFGLKFDDRMSKRWHLGHTGFLVLMAITTLGVIWCPVESVSDPAKNRKEISMDLVGVSEPTNSTTKRQSDKALKGKEAKK